MTSASSLGLLASTLSTVTVSGGLFLQMKKIWQLKKASQLSLGWLSLGVITWLGWFVYGLSIGDKYIYIANGVGLVLQTGLFTLAWRFRRS